jgi:glyoxylase I family protein
MTPRSAAESVGRGVSVPGPGAHARVAALHHLAITVSDVEASATWYECVLGLQRLPSPFPHYGDESPGFAILPVEPTAGWAIGVHHHQRHRSGAADETLTGLDHVGLPVPRRADLDDWSGRLDALGVSHSGVTDMEEPVPCSALVFRDPDDIQLELVHLPGRLPA